MLSGGEFSSNKKQVEIVILVCFLFGLFTVLSVSGCEKKNASGPAAAKELTLATGEDLKTLDIMDIGGQAHWIPSQMYETLVIPNDKMQPQPLLAESWERVDTLTWRFHLRKGVKFHDGTPLNAQAVKFSLERTQNEGPKWAVLPIKTITADDDYTVTIRTDKPFSPLVEHMMSPSFSIVSPTALAKDKAVLEKNSVGTGPFKLEEYVPHQKVIMVRNEDYWGTKPKLNKLVMKIITDPNTRVMALQTGEVDAIRDVPLPDIAKLQADPKLKVMMTLGTRTTYYGFNTDRDYFKDVRVRQAFNYAFDKEALVKHILYGIGQPAKGFVTPTIPGYTDIVGYKHDPVKAKQLLAEVGWKDTDGDGILDKDGKPFKVALVTGSMAAFTKPVAELFQAQLKEVGVTVEIKAMEWGALTDAVDKRDFDLVEDASPARSGGADYQLMSRFHSTINPTIHVRTGYVNKRVDELLEQARQEVDESKRLQMYQEIQQIIDQDAAVIPLFYEMEVAVINSRVTGFKPHPAIWPIDLSAVDIAT
jgi:peptide/nickel transport system substrate-binding protein